MQHIPCIRSLKRSLNSRRRLHLAAFIILLVTTGLVIAELFLQNNVKQQLAEEKALRLAPMKLPSGPKTRNRASVKTLNKGGDKTFKNGTNPDKIGLESLQPPKKDQGVPILKQPKPVPVPKKGPVLKPSTKDDKPGQKPNIKNPLVKDKEVGLKQKEGAVITKKVGKDAVIKDIAMNIPPHAHDKKDVAKGAALGKESLHHNIPKESLGLDHNKEVVKLEDKRIQSKGKTQLKKPGKESIPAVNPKVPNKLNDDTKEALK